MVRDLGEWRPGFYSEFRYASREHGGLAWGALGKMTKLREMHTFWKWACPKFPEIYIFLRKKPHRVRPNIEELFRLTGYGHWGPIIGFLLTDWRHWGPIIGILLTDWRHWGPIIGIRMTDWRHWSPVMIIFQYSPNPTLPKPIEQIIRHF